MKELTREDYNAYDYTYIPYRLYIRLRFQKKLPLKDLMFPIISTYPFSDDILILSVSLTIFHLLSIPLKSL